MIPEAYNIELLVAMPGFGFFPGRMIIKVWFCFIVWCQNFIYNCNGFGSTANKQKRLVKLLLSCRYINTPGLDFFQFDKIILPIMAVPVTKK